MTYNHFGLPITLALVIELPSLVDTAISALELTLGFWAWLKQRALRYLDGHSRWSGCGGTRSLDCIGRSLDC